MDDIQHRPLAAVTGASSGIGFELAKVFGAERFDLIVAAEETAEPGSAKEDES